MATLTDFAAAIKAKLDAKASNTHNHDTQYVRTVNGTAPDGAGNVTVAGDGGGGTDDWAPAVAIFTNGA